MKAIFSLVISVFLLAQGTFGLDIYWTPWLDRDDPSGHGDFETYTDSAVKCNNGYSPINAECRVKGSYGYWYNANQIIHEAYRCTTLGFACKNSNQPGSTSATEILCKDYEIRFLCYKP